MEDKNQHVYPLHHNDPELLRKAKMYAYFENTTVKAKILGWLKAWIKEREDFEQSTRDQQ